MAQGSAGRRRRGGLAVLALLALLFQALLPPGYMLAETRGGAPAVVICTGHGPLTLPDPADRQLPPHKQKASAVCAFAGHGAAPVLATSQPLAEIRWTGVALAATDRPSVFIGRGLAAPPPARGPPAILV